MPLFAGGYPLVRPEASMPTGALLRAPLALPGPGGTQQEERGRSLTRGLTRVGTGTETTAHGFPRSIVWVGARLNRGPI